MLLPKKKRWQSKGYLDHVRGLPCSVPKCNRVSVPHHVKAGGMGTKCDDSLVVPLCDPFGHHSELHQIGKKSFEAKYELDLISLAKEHFASYNEASNR